MLRHTFIHLPGIGPHRERKLWEQGICDWDRFLDAAATGILTKKMCESAVPLVRQSLEAIAVGDPRFFHTHLPTRETWRLYTEFADRACFLDIETTGLSADYDKVTTIGALGGDKLALFVQGVNLDQFPAYIAQFPLLVTFNGSQFDVPFLRTHFPQARLDHAHIDLRFVFHTLGYRGGLKEVERNLGLRRDQAIQGVDGIEAVRLWHRYRRGDRAALVKLAFYNLTDVVNLVELMDIAVTRKLRQGTFPVDLLTAEPARTRTLDSEYVGNWVAQQLETWRLA
jgi:uncharacterized protein YprB with RNaseH-like and TPR domain